MGVPMEMTYKVWVTCPPCAHTWIAAYLPMEMRKAAILIAQTRCPKCGEKKGLTMASTAEIEASEQTRQAGAA